MKSYNVTSKGNRWPRFGRHLGLSRKSAFGFPVTAPQKKLWFGIEEAAGLLEPSRRVANRFRRQKQLANNSAAVQRNKLSQTGLNDAESDVSDGCCEGMSGFATASATEFRWQPTIRDEGSNRQLLERPNLMGITGLRSFMQGSRCIAIDQVADFQSKTTFAGVGA